MTRSVLLPFRQEAMTPAQLAAVSYLARYTGRTHALYAYQLRRLFTWCQSHALGPPAGMQRAHVEFYIRHLHDSGLRGLRDQHHAARGARVLRFAHIDGLMAADAAIYARLPKIHADETRTQGLGRLELIRFLQVARTLTVHQGALAFLLVAAHPDGSRAQTAATTRSVRWRA